MNVSQRMWSQAIVLAVVMLIAPNLWAGRLGPHLERVIETEGPVLPETNSPARSSAQSTASN